MAPFMTQQQFHFFIEEPKVLEAIRLPSLLTILSSLLRPADEGNFLFEDRLNFNS